MAGFANRHHRLKRAEHMHAYPWLHRLCDPLYTDGVPRLYQRNAPLSLERLGAMVLAWFPELLPR